MCVRILETELARRGAPATVGEQLPWPAVDKFADPGLQAELKPQVASGEVRFCLGYTEPDGGSDIAGAKTRAVRDGDEWVINGQKIFTSHAQNSQYVFLITRTNPTLPKHKGQTVTAQLAPPTAPAGPPPGQARRLGRLGRLPEPAGCPDLLVRPARLNRPPVAT